MYIQPETFISMRELMNVPYVNIITYMYNKIYTQVFKFGDFNVGES